MKRTLRKCRKCGRLRKIPEDRTNCDKCEKSMWYHRKCCRCIRPIYIRLNHKPICKQCIKKYKIENIYSSNYGRRKT